MGLFSRGKKEKAKNKLLMDGVTFSECLNILLSDDASEEDLDKASDFYDASDFFDNEGFEATSECAGTVYVTLLLYYGLLPKNMDIAASNIACAASELVEAAGERDPYEAKDILEALFKKWPQAFHKAVQTATADESESDLFFLCCTKLFGWDGAPDMTQAKVYLDKIGDLGEIDNYDGYEWLKKQIQ